MTQCQSSGFESQRPRHFAAPRAPAGGAAFWRPKPRAPQRPCQPCKFDVDLVFSPRTSSQLSQFSHSLPSPTNHASATSNQFSQLEQPNNKFRKATCLSFHLDAYSILTPTDAHASHFLPNLTIALPHSSHDSPYLSAPINSLPIKTLNLYIIQHTLHFLMLKGSQ